MSAKKAKAIRADIGYHPSDESLYENERKSKKKSQGTLVLSDRCSRYLYQEMKKEAKRV